MANVSSTVKWARRAMELRPVAPPPPTEIVGDLQEVFDHPYFLNADETARASVRRASSESKYAGEKLYPWDHYFEHPIATFLHGRDVLDLGCFNGGRTVAWYERYGLRSVSGIDVREEYLVAARAFAESRNCSARFELGFGESLPFSESEFDAVVTFDVLEHVRDVEATLNECWRVLRPGGTLIAVFPGYFQPNEHHLGLATGVPGLQLFFSGATLVRAYSEILLDRGEQASWYRRGSPVLADWERGHTLNGITFQKFTRLIDPTRWRILSMSRRPIGSVGRNLARWPRFTRLASTLRPLTFVPGIQEVLLHRIATVLEKRPASPVT
jgi:SAM-dependent methyltransferase